MLNLPEASPGDVSPGVLTSVAEVIRRGCDEAGRAEVDFAVLVSVLDALALAEVKPSPALGAFVVLDRPRVDCSDGAADLGRQLQLIAWLQLLYLVAELPRPLPFLLLLPAAAHSLGLFLGRDARCVVSGNFQPFLAFLIMPTWPQLKQPHPQPLKVRRPAPA